MSQCANPQFILSSRQINYVLYLNPLLDFSRKLEFVSQFEFLLSFSLLSCPFYLLWSSTSSNLIIFALASSFYSLCFARHLSRSLVTQVTRRLSLRQLRKPCHSSRCGHVLMLGFRYAAVQVVFVSGNISSG